MSFVCAKRFALRIRANKSKSADMRGETILKRSQLCRSMAACGLLGAFLFAMALSASPRLHERFHPDVKRSQHECAVTLVAAGSYHHAAPAPLIASPAAAAQFSKIPALDPQWVQSPFLGASIFEHAPPAHS
jgi:hypothetical protein